YRPGLHAAHGGDARRRGLRGDRHGPFGHRLRPGGAQRAAGGGHAQRAGAPAAAGGGAVNVAVVGTGYVGLVAGACLAETGNDVVGADLDAAKIEALRHNRLPIYEPGLEPLVTRNQRDGRLQFTTDVGAAIERSDVIFIAVGTPPDEDGSADLTHVLDVASAEMTKYAANAMLATRISCMNQIARLCDVVGADVTLVRKGIGSDRRIGPAVLFPGPGYGGSCFPKDVKALIRTAQDCGVTLDVLDAVEAANERQKRVLYEKLARHFGGKLRNVTVGVWGLAFKAETDDVRESPALVLVEQLLEA